MVAKNDERAERASQALLEGGVAKRLCPECLEPTQGRQVFCSPAHKLAFHNRCTVRGKAIVPLLMAARIPRNRGPAASRAWREARTLLDQYAKEDKAAGRMSAVDYVAIKWAGGF